jgi:hypothetical protein
MTTIDVASVMHEKASDSDDAAAARCPACVHPVDAHDVIATRFCAATTARALARGCACRR